MPRGAVTGPGAPGGPRGPAAPCSPATATIPIAPCLFCIYLPFIPDVPILSLGLRNVCAEGDHLKNEARDHFFSMCGNRYKAS